jgi:hypothetical protein
VGFLLGVAGRELLLQVGSSVSFGPVAGADGSGRSLAPARSLCNLHHRKSLLGGDAH